MSFLKIGTRSRYALRFMIELAEVERAARSDETRRRGYVKLRTVASFHFMNCLSLSVHNSIMCNYR